MCISVYMQHEEQKILSDTWRDIYKYMIGLWRMHIVLK